MRRREPSLFFFTPSNKASFANREFTASLQALSELPASIWTRDGCSAAKYAARLFLGLEFRPRPRLPFTVSASSFFSSCISLSFFVHYVRHMALTSVMQYDLFLLSTVDIEHNLTLCWHQHAHTRTHTHTPTGKGP